MYQKFCISLRGLKTKLVPVGGELLPDLRLPPSFPLPLSCSLSSLPSLLPFLLTVYQVHHPLTPRFALANGARALAHARTPARTSRPCTAPPRKRDKELVTPKGPASVTLLPRLDHMAAGASRSERIEGGGVETRVGGEEMETSGAK